MRSCRYWLLGLVFVISAGYAFSYPSDSEIRQRLVRLSMTQYLRDEGLCPCPYSLDDKGQLCGDRSAWSVQGSASVLCYSRDVDKMMIYRYQESLRECDSDRHRVCGAI